MLTSRCATSLIKSQNIGRCARRLVLSSKVNNIIITSRAYSKLPQNPTNNKNINNNNKSNTLAKAPKNITPTQTKRPTNEEEEDDDEDAPMPDVDTKDALVGKLTWDPENGYVGKSKVNGKEIPFGVLSEDPKEIVRLVPFIRRVLPKLDELDTTARHEAAHDYVMTEEEKIVYKQSGKWRYQARVRDRLEKLARIGKHPKEFSGEMKFSAPTVDIKDETEYVTTFTGIVTLKEFKERLGKVPPAYLFYIGQEGCVLAVSFGDNGMFSDSHFLVEFNEALDVENITIEG